MRVQLTLNARALYCHERAERHGRFIRSLLFTRDQRVSEKAMVGFVSRTVTDVMRYFDGSLADRDAIDR